MTFSNLFHCSFQQATQLLQHQDSKQYWRLLYFSSFSDVRIIFHIMGIIHNFVIQALSRTSYAKFQNFQAPNLFSRTFQDLEKWKNFFKSFQRRVAVWLSGNIVGRINEVALRRAGLVLRWVTVRRYLTKPPRLTQPGHPSAGRRNEYWQWLRPSLRKKRWVLHSSRPCYQDCQHTDPAG